MIAIIGIIVFYFIARGCLKLSDYMAVDYPCVEVKRANNKMIKEFGRVLTNKDMLGLKPKQK